LASEASLIAGLSPVRISHCPGSSPMASEVRVPVRSVADIVTARQQVRQLAGQAGFSNSNLTLIATAISEVARNIVEYASSGELIVSVIKNGTRNGVKIIAKDQGPGIADITAVMRDGYSTGKGLGIGLPGTRRLMDEFEITSTPGKGTTVTMKKWTA
jgi:serine/threonine-protein kinase RsbT